MNTIFGKTNPAGTALVEYPFDVRKAYPATSFPPDVSEESLSPDMVADGVVRVYYTGQPVGDFASVTPGAPAKSSGKWSTTWITVPRTLDERRAQVATAIDSHAKHLRDQIVRDFSPAEMASWPIKQAQAKAFAQSGDAADAPALEDEAGFRQIPLADLVDKVMAKSAQLSAIEAAIAGESGRRQDILKTATAQGIEVINGEIASGWPSFG